MGRWKLVISLSTARNRKPGVIKRAVFPRFGSKSPSALITLSSVLQTVVPTAKILPPLARTLFNRSAAEADTSRDSSHMRCRMISSSRTGRKVPGPTCRVTKITSIPFSIIAWSNGSVKWHPAVGAGDGSLLLSVNGLIPFSI